MNLADTVKIVLKTKTQYLLKSFLQKDLIIILKESGTDLYDLGKAGMSSIFSLREIKKISNLGSDLVLIFKVLPQRIRTGFFYLKEDFLVEFEKLSTPDQKKTLCLTVIGSLVRMCIPQTSKLKNQSGKFSLQGLKRTNDFTYVLINKIIHKISQVFVFRLLEEVEEELSLDEDLEWVKYFKELITGQTDNYDNLFKHNVPKPGEPSFQIVENLELFIMTGRVKRVIFNYAH